MYLLLCQEAATLEWVLQLSWPVGESPGDPWQRVRPACTSANRKTPERFACVSLERLWGGTFRRFTSGNLTRRCVSEGTRWARWPGKSQMGKSPFKHHRGLLQTTCGKALASNVAWSVYVLHADSPTVHQNEEAPTLASVHNPVSAVTQGSLTNALPHLSGSLLILPNPRLRKRFPEGRFRSSSSSAVQCAEVLTHNPPWAGGPKQAPLFSWVLPRSRSRGSLWKLIRFFSFTSWHCALGS